MSREPAGGPARAFPATSVSLLVALTLALSVTSIGIAWRLHGDAERLVRTELVIRTTAARIMLYDEVLTMSAKMGAATGDPRWEERYRRFDPLLTADLRTITALAPEAFLGSSARATDDANDALVAMEGDAFDLVRAHRASEATALLESDAYQAQKTIYSAGMRRVEQTLSAREDRMLLDQKRRLLVLLLFSVLAWAILVVLWFRLVALIRESQRARDLAERSLTRANEVLENRVLERTRQLEDANEVIRRDAEEKLKVALELRHVQKLTAVGQLAAGIAHEINTPTQFVSDSVRFLAAGFRDALALVARYRQALQLLTAATNRPELARQMDEAEESSDIAYLESHAPAAFSRALEGLSQISTIVGAMRDFAHPDRGEKSPADLNQALKATLAIARNEYKYVADVETEIGELPLVPCHRNDMSQVFLNLIVNAGHAIADVVGKSRRKGRLRVRTALEGEDVRIDIADTGCGIPEAIRERIFEPFFTTKEVGRGSGKGLAIARSIVVDKHGGSLTFETELGRGTTFTIRLPAKGAPAVSAGSIEPIAA